jgi:hypothetical protein
MASTSDLYDIEAVRREWVGKASDVVVGRYPVEYDPIRRHCHMVEDTNPLFLDPGVAAKSRHGGVIAPPVMVDYFAGNGVWPPRSEAGVGLSRSVPTRGNRFINLNTPGSSLGQRASGIGCRARSRSWTCTRSRSASIQRLSGS